MRGLGGMALVAFVSLWVQVAGLVGSHGIVPAAETFQAIRGALGRTPWAEMPTLLWLDAGDAALHGLCAAGVVLSLLVLLDVAPALGLLGVAAAYLSLVHAGDVFLQFQWDSLLVEACLVGALYAPWRLGRGGGRDPDPPVLARWLVWWLLFRLMFESGVVKLTYGDESWKDLTAMTFHYWTQPLPHFASWTAAHLPLGAQKASCFATFAIELILPFFVLAFRRLRHVAAWGMISLHVMIAATGNYGFFNALSALLCASLFDDRALATMRIGRATAPFEPLRRRSWAKRVFLPVIAVVPIAVGTRHLADVDPNAPATPLPIVDRLESAVGPFLAVNPYGLFRVMTKTRPEIRVQGLPVGADPGDDGAWREYVFRWKPGADLAATPRWVQPHMPRLDWRLWFEALRWEPWARRGLPYPERASPWFQRFLFALLQAEPAVLDLLGGDPFDGAKPAAVRAQLWDYRFTTRAERDATGAIWVAAPLDRRGVTLQSER